jgi:hypothetical protein
MNSNYSGENSGSNEKDNNLNIMVNIALYDNMKSIPRVIGSSYGDIGDLINDTSQKVYSYSHEMGGKIPYTIIREVVENLIHADFREIVITIMSEGNHILVSDQGPGISDIEKAFLPGYTSATTSMKRYIRGVGSGLPIVKETITFSGGTIDISDNIKKGTVISLKLDSGGDASPKSAANDSVEQSSNTDEIKLLSSENALEDLNRNMLTNRQKKILFLIMELDKAGPSTIAEELGFSLSTSYRELVFLEKNKLLYSDGTGKRKLSKKGLKYLEYYSNNL